jgi:hypothetical protein
MGSYHGHHGFETFSHARAVLTQSLPSALKLAFPPYTSKVERFVALVRKLVG